MSAETVGRTAEDILEKSKITKPYLDILKEKIPLDEKMTAIYMLAMQRLGDFRRRRTPGMPAGFIELHQDFKMAKDDEKKKIWAKMQEVHKGYFKELGEAEAENASNKHFLKEMEKHFESKGMLSNAQRIAVMLTEYAMDDYEGV